ncbi:uncharacterized protein [Palaemon carinicauda]|uniref:uncharacterized protein n=1 Tax=Palaemon carinicauda TaxID=392227 RepID=UPI0035B65AAC
MVKLLFFPFALILAFASAQADDKFFISDANNSVNFPGTDSSYTFLASCTSDINNEIIFEGFVILQYNPQRLFEYIYNSSESNTWNFFEIHRSSEDVEINPGNRRYELDWSYDLRIRITSTKKTYWRFCANIYQCDLPAPVPSATEFPVGSTTTQRSIVSSTVPASSTRHTALEITTIVFLSICCLLVAIVIGMAVCLIRVRRTSLNEPARNLEPENISHNPQMFNVSTFSSPQEDHESINSLYGFTINREWPK